MTGDTQSGTGATIFQKRKSMSFVRTIQCWARCVGMTDGKPIGKALTRMRTGSHWVALKDELLEAI